MSATAVRPVPSSSPREVRKRLRAVQQRTSVPITLYYGSLEDDDVFRCEAFGRRITIMPDAFVGDLNDLNAPQKKYDGTVVIKDVMGAGRWSRDRAVNRNLSGSVVIQSAVDVAFQIMRRGQERGLTQLTGNPDEDLRLKREATARWVAWRRLTAGRTIVAYRKECEGMRREGLTPREMDYREMLAQRFLEDDQGGVYRAYMQVLSPFKYHCEEAGCGRPEKDFERFLRHLKFTHQLSDEDIEKRYKDVLEASEAAPAKLSGARPAKEDKPVSDEHVPADQKPPSGATARLAALQPGRSIRPVREKKT